MAPVILRHREGGLELGWDAREMKLGKFSQGPRPVSLLVARGFGVLWKLKRAAMLESKQSNLLKQPRR